MTFHITIAREIRGGERWSQTHAWTEGESASVRGANLIADIVRRMTADEGGGTKCRASVPPVADRLFDIRVELTDVHRTTATYKIAKTATRKCPAAVRRLGREMYHELCLALHGAACEERKNDEPRQ